MSPSLPTIIFTASLLCAGFADAASINVCQCETATGNIAHSMYLDGSGVGEFNTITVSITPNAPATFLNYDADGTLGLPSFPIDPGIILGPGSEYTFTNPLLWFPPLFGGMNFVIVGNTDDGPVGISYTTGPLGAFIDASSPIFLNNVIMSPGSSAAASIRLENTGQVVFQATFIEPLTPPPGQRPIGRCPEPSSLVLGGMSLIGLVLRRRNG